MSKDVEILMRRDDLTREEAEDLVQECREALEAGDEYATEDILGLEPDYIFDILL